MLAQKPVEQIQINAPYVTSDEAVVDAMLDLAGVRSSDVVYDLGCGDGRIVIAAAKRFGARGVGVDINSSRVEEARANARAARVEPLVRFETRDLFDTEIRDATVVMLYLLPDINLRLRPLLLKELKPGARVVSHDFNMGGWKPDKEVIVSGAHLYLWVVP